MERAIQTGDIAVIRVNGKEQPLTITDANSTRIKAIGYYTLIPIGDGWTVQNHPSIQPIRFEAGPSITHIPEITSKILLPLNYKDLIAACETNKDFDRVCRDDYFWKLKVERDYGDIVSDKPSNITYRQQYADLVNIRNPKRAARLGRLDILKWLAKHNIFAREYEYDASSAAIDGRLEILKWMIQTGSPFPSQYSINSVARNGHLEVLKWLATTKNLYPDKYGANHAAMRGHLEVLKWLAQYNIYPDAEVVSSVAEHGDTEILKWLAQRDRSDFGLPPTDVSPDRFVVNLAAFRGRLDALKEFAKDGIYPDKEGAVWAVKNNKREVLQWLAQHGIYPN